MKKNLHIISVLFLSLIITSCQQADNKPLAGMTDLVIPADSVKIPEVVQQLANTPEQVLAKPEVPVLCYHRIAEGKKGDYGQ